MRTRTLVALTLAIAGSLASPAYVKSEDFSIVIPPELPEIPIPTNVITGKPTEMRVDSSDVVVKFGDVKEPCGSTVFLIQRTNTNFKELTAVALTALSAGKTLGLFVGACKGKSNIVSAGSLIN